MTHELITRWIEVLESGKYKQNHRRMRMLDDTFCALGVLCDISGLGAWELSQKTGQWEYRTSTGTRSSAPNDELGTILRDAKIDYSVIAFMNDTKFLPFEAIAAYIRGTQLYPTGTGL